MKILGRVILFILALILLAGLLCVLSTFVAIPWLSDYVAGLMKSYSWLPLVLGIFVLFCMAAAVLALILLVSVPTKRRLYILKRAPGQIEITNRSIESTTAHIIGEIPGVKRSQVRLKGNPGPHKIKIHVDVEPRDATAPLAQLGETIQNNVREGLENSLAISPKAIKVKIHETEYQKGTNGHRGKSKVPRVI